MDSRADKPISDKSKLKQGGNLIYESSLSLLERFQKYSEKKLQQKIVIPRDTQVDKSFGAYFDSWTQQSISTAFLDRYLVSRQKANYERQSTVFIQELTTSEAIWELVKEDYRENNKEIPIARSRLKITN